MAEFKSNLKNRLNDFISFKRSIGKKYSNILYYVRFVDEANLKIGNYDYLTKEVLKEAVNSAVSKCKSLDRSFYSYFRELSKYLNTIDGKSYILGDNYKSKRYHANIYLFSNEEIRKFFSTLDNMTYESGKNHMYIAQAIFYVMYFCGIRCVEARLLKTEDVHIDERYLIIRNSKNHNDRKLFITDEVVRMLKELDDRLSLTIPERKYFFSVYKDNEYSQRFIPSHFTEAWIRAGMSMDVTPRPRAYDFRHHFACANIMRWMDEGKDVHAMLPYLMTYMGHSSLESTYYYIHLIPEFFSKYNELSSLSDGLLPEVEDYELYF